MLGNRMNKTPAILKILIFGVILVGISLLFWQFVLTGILLLAVYRGRHDQWVCAIAALIVVLIMRIWMNRWPIFVENETAPLAGELLLGLVSWALGSIGVSSGYRMPAFFIEGLRHTTYLQPALEHPAPPPNNRQDFDKSTTSNT